MVKKVIKFAVHVLLVVFLTLWTQLGGVAFILVSVVLNLLQRKKPMTRKGLWRLVLFIPFYVLLSFGVVPFLAPLFGREALPVFDETLRPNNAFFWITNRHYVTPKLRQTIVEISKKVETKYPGTKIAYLDANFPFIDGFPLLPHLSHSDGKKLDLAFFYEHPTGELAVGNHTVLGYGVCEAPVSGEINQPRRCEEQGHWHYSLSKDARELLGLSSELTLREAASAYLVEQLALHPNTQKIFIEPHLKTRWKVNYPKVRFHGCHAVRHDDHIHFQVY